MTGLASMLASIYMPAGCSAFFSASCFVAFARQARVAEVGKQGEIRAALRKGLAR